MKLFLSLLMFSTLSFALIISPNDAMQAHYPQAIITKQSMILTKKEHAKVQKMAHAKLKSKLFRLYRAKKDDKTLGFGILLTHKVRTKTAAILYILNPKGTLQSIEIIAFNEPMDYMPSKRWLKQFTQSNPPYKRNGNIITISGATLSANALIHAANLAQSIWKIKLKP